MLLGHCFVVAWIFCPSLSCNASGWWFIRFFKGNYRHWADYFGCVAGSKRSVALPFLHWKASNHREHSAEGLPGTKLLLNLQGLSVSRDSSWPGRSLIWKILGLWAAINSRCGAEQRCDDWFLPRPLDFTDLIDPLVNCHCKSSLDIATHYSESPFAGFAFVLR